MKAPDKIYLTEWNGEGISEYDTPWSSVPYDEKTQPCKNYEYIRKDALLEWAKEQKSFEQGFEDGEAEHGYKCALDDLIEKVKSL